MSSEWFRRNQKKFLGVFVIVLMAAWGIGPAISMLGSQFGDKPVGTIFGKKITQNEFNSAIRRWSRVFLRESETPVVETVWKQLMLVSEAERLGIRVSDGEVLEGIRIVSSKLFGEYGNVPVDRLIAALCNTFGVGTDQLFKTIREALTVEKLDQFIKDSIKVSSDEAWQKFSRTHEKAKVKYIALKAKDLVDYVQVDEDEIQAFYDEYRDEFPNPSEGVPGYKENEKVQIEYLMVQYDDLIDGVTVTAEDIQKYYEDNKDTKYRVEGSAPAKEETAHKHEHEDGEECEHDHGAEAEEEAETPVEYKPFEDVEEEISKTLQRQKAEEMAGEIMNKVDDQIVSELGTKERTSFEDFSKEYSVTHIVPPYFEMKDANRVIRGTDKLSLVAFEREKNDPTPPYSCADGRFIFQVIDKKPPGAPPLEEIHDKVERDLREEKALRKMRELAGKITEKIKGNDFDEGARLLQAEIFEIIQQGPTTDHPSTEDQAFTIEHDETDYFARPGYTGDRPFRHIAALEGDRPNVAAKAFNIKEGEVAIVVEERGNKACYIISLIDIMEADRDKFEEDKDLIIDSLLAEKQSAFMAQWLDDLNQKATLEARYAM